MNLKCLSSNFNLALFLILSIACALPTALAQPSGQPAQIGRFTSRFEKGGLYLDYNEVPLFKGGVVQVFYSDSRQDDYGSGSNPPVATDTLLLDGGHRYVALFDNSGAVGVFHGEQSILVHPDGSVIFELRARWDGAHSATLEWNPIRLWCYPLVGSHYTSQTPAGSVSGTIGRHPVDSKYPANSLPSPWSQLTIKSLGLGELNFAADASGLEIAFDAREDQYLKDLKVIWFGDTGLELKPGQEVTRKISFSITPLSAETIPAISPDHAVAPVQLKVETTRISNAVEPQIPARDATEDVYSPTVVPHPKQAAFSADAVWLHGKIVLYLDNALITSSGIQIAATEFLEGLKQDTGIGGSIQHERSRSSPGIHVGLSSSALGAAEHVPGSSALPPEGYTIMIAGKCIQVTGADERGAFYGLQTLRQLLFKDAKGRFYYAGAEIADWPSLEFRGAHVFVGKDALALHSNLIKTILSRYKLNELVIECEYMRWVRHPELWRENSMDPNDLAKVVMIAKDHFIEPIPLINTLGHSDWIFKNGVHLDLAEDENSPHIYDPSNPGTYKLVFDIFDEALGLFKNPRYFHIGHDEVKVPSYDKIGKYPARPANILKGAGDLFLEDANHLADWLRMRGATPMMWGDMLLNATEGTNLPRVPEMTAAFAPSPAEAERRRAAVPHDAIICDWRYEPGAEQRNGLQLFEAAGHKAIGSAWFQPKNIQGWAQRAVETHALGTLQTTWAGYDLNESILETEFPQFSAYILAAEYAWDGGSAGNTNASALDAASLFRKAYRSGQSLNMRKGASRSNTGWYISLRRAANINLFGDSAAGDSLGRLSRSTTRG